jgi:SAM-dependent methyltransferase
MALNHIKTTAERIERERTFHNELAASGFSSRRLLDRMSSGFYAKGDDSALWGPVWKTLDLRQKICLDYGCGNGGFSRELIRRGATVYAMDISEELIQINREQLLGHGNEPNFAVADAHDTGFPDAFFDYVFGNGILHHLELGRAYKEISRILKPGGRAFFMEPLNANPAVAILRKLTPSARSIDEQPLRQGDIDRARPYFSIRQTEHFLTSVVVAPLHLISDRFTTKVISKIDLWDQRIMKTIPRTRRLAWLTMLEFQKPAQY